MRLLSLLLLPASLLLCADAVTIYTTFTTDSAGNPLKPTNPNTAVGPAYTGLTAYNLSTLTPPDLPSPLPNLNIGVQLYTGGYNNLSIPQKGNFFGYSIELSVANQFLGRNSSRINVPFLNYLSNIRARAGAGPIVRVGGNSQENTQLYFTPFPNDEIINKTLETTPNDPTATPEVNVDIDLVYTMNNISAFVNTHWYLGLPFAYPLNISGITEMTAIYEGLLGDRLIALQMGNEPDLYALPGIIGFRKRPFAYYIPQYLQEWSEVIPAIQNNTAIVRQDIMLAPSMCCNLSKNWSIQNVLDAGFLTEFGSSLAQLSVQYYPLANCPGTLYNSEPINAQVIYGNYLFHTNVQKGAAQYISATTEAVAAGKPMVMFETNTASCAGFSGLSDSFGAALWAVDWTLQLAFANFSTVLFHFGGQDAAYNAFTPPPSNYSGIYQWTTGTIYYGQLVVAEALGSSNQSQVVDMQLNDNNPYTVGYAIYEQGNPARVVLINFMDDHGDGSATYTGYVHIGTGDQTDTATPTSVTVRYLAAPSVSEKFNVTWAGQSLGGGQWLSDGILRGDVVTQTVQCNPQQGCPITVPAPGLALVFLTSQAQTESFDDSLTETYPTTWYKYGGSGPSPVGEGVLETSNGRGGPQMGQYPLGSTSHGEDLRAWATRGATISLGAVVLAMATGAWAVGRALVR